ncbi:programmed cell death protein [Entophlyctis luteolus]|nr:programmed cell death protein [Entophlyctis luteolus]
MGPELSPCLYCPGPSLAVLELENQRAQLQPPTAASSSIATFAIVTSATATNQRNAAIRRRLTAPPLNPPSSLSVLIPRRHAATAASSPFPASRPDSLPPPRSRSGSNSIKATRRCSNDDGYCRPCVVDSPHDADDYDDIYDNDEHIRRVDSADDAAQHLATDGYDFAAVRAVRCPVAVAHNSAKSPPPPLQPQAPSRSKLAKSQQSLNPAKPKAKPKSKAAVPTNTKRPPAAPFVFGTLPSPGTPNFDSDAVFGDSTTSVARDIEALLARRDQSYSAWTNDDDGNQNSNDINIDGDNCGSAASNNSIVKESKKDRAPAIPEPILRSHAEILLEANSSKGPENPSTNIPRQPESADIPISAAIKELKVLPKSAPASNQGESSDVKAQLPFFPVIHLEFVSADFLESSRVVDDLSHEMSLLRAYQESENVAMQDLLDFLPDDSDDKRQKGKKAPQDAEKYEKTHIHGVTKAFRNFQKVVALEPEQCIRYAFDSTPLLYSDGPAPAVPPCTHCGAPRTFEMQLMPAILSCIPAPPPTRAATAGRTPPSRDILRAALGIDFATLLVYVCRANCLADSPRPAAVAYSDEFVVVQHDCDW